VFPQSVSALPSCLAPGLNDGADCGRDHAYTWATPNSYPLAKALRLGVEHSVSCDNLSDQEASIAEESVKIESLCNYRIDLRLFSLYLFDSIDD